MRKGKGKMKRKSSRMRTMLASKLNPLGGRVVTGPESKQGPITTRKKAFNDGFHRQCKVYMLFISMSRNVLNYIDICTCQGCFSFYQ